jgi:hypothetical protein
MDGDIDYSMFTRAQLTEALTRIDRARYPKNLSNLLTTLAASPIDPSDPSQKRSLVRWDRICGWYSILATAAVVVTSLISTFTAPKPLTVSGNLSVRILLALVPLIVVPIAILTLSGAAGIALVRERRCGRILGIAAFGTQLVALTIPGISYSYVPLIAFQAFYSGGTFGLTASLGPDLVIRTGSSEPIYVAVDVVAIVGILVLAKLRSVRAAG